MAISFDRSICCELNETISREWLVTNGLGGYAAGTVAGVLTRMPHGLLVASPPNVLQPQLLLAKIDEELTFDQRTYYLGTNEYRDGIFNPSGFVHLEAFRLEEGFPIFTYRLGGIDGLILEKRIWMARGFNTTYIQYNLRHPLTLDKPAYKRSDASGPQSLNNGRLAQANEQDESKQCIITLLPFTANRPYNMPKRGQQAPQVQVKVHKTEDTNTAGEEDPASYLLPRGSAGCTITANTIEVPYHLIATSQPENQATFIPTGVWYWNFLRRCDAAAGLPDTDDLYLPGVFRATLCPDSQSTLTIVVSTEELAPQLYQHRAITALYKKNIEQRQSTLERALRPQPAPRKT
ncbi:glycogen debranching enzyme N-terminal domain-containing protein [Dictyobacter kobayashii]|uniref:Glycogen debranching enzyme bacterial and archaeal type N-terminal domain-containing protein n=1 Tax=Dictyobacter kobayashii TaxID=2014872 RepID=A0A402AI25_9CHLR|nr:glycogen debranching enzyme N-terminal domain-containing protein [Dictyobacter kobayashii]GCE18770.1 hypothetical protein KDK_25700 [Dictyobacter kobayashii]